MKIIHLDQRIRRMFRVEFLGFFCANSYESNVKLARACDKATIQFFVTFHRH